jgi:hypothetical protein
VVVVLVLSTLVVGGVAEAPASGALATLRALFGQTPAVPASWTVFADQGVVGAVPPDYGPPRPASVPPQSPIAGYLLFRSNVMITLWEGSVREVIDGRWLKGNLQPYTRRPMSGRDGEEVVIGGISWSDPSRGSGRYEARHLFVQLRPGLAADIALAPPLDALTPGGEAKVAASDRAVQDQIATYLRAAPDTDAKIDRTRVEAVVRRVVRELQAADIPPGNPNRPKMFSGEQWAYEWPNGFAYIVVYADRAARERDSGERAVEWSAPVVRRGVGNVVVLVGSADANLRYRVIAALDDLAK